MKLRSPKLSIKHNKAAKDKANQSTNTFKKWIRDPNGVLAIVTIILALIALGALYISLRALYVSEDTEKRQLRAYIAATVQNMEIKHTTLYVKFAIENYGQSPCKNFKIKGDINILPFPLPKRYEFQIPSIEIEHGPSVYPREAKPPTVGPTRVFTKAEITEITSKDTHRAAYVFGVLTYEDIFGESHFTKFCFFVNPYSIKSIKKDKTGVSKTFDWVDCNQHNDFN